MMAARPNEPVSRRLAEAKVNEQQVAVTLYQIKEVINHLFLGR